MLRKIVYVSGDSDTLTIPELKKYKGRKVEITLKELTETKKPTKDLRKYFGILKPAGDALEFQKKVRSEWDEREKYF